MAKKWKSKHKTLKCPKCSKRNDIEAIICEKCDYVLKPKFVIPCCDDSRINERLDYEFKLLGGENR